MTALRWVQRACFVVAVVAGLKLIAGQLVEDQLPLGPAVAWMASTAGVILTDRLMKVVARRNASRNETPEENR